MVDFPLLRCFENVGWRMIEGLGIGAGKRERAGDDKEPGSVSGRKRESHGFWTGEREKDRESAWRASESQGVRVGERDRAKDVV